MTAQKAPALPGTPPPSLQAAYGALSAPRAAVFHEHLLGGTSANYLSDWMRRAGAPVGATTIKDYRRSLRQIGVCK